MLHLSRAAIMSAALSLSTIVGGASPAAAQSSASSSAGAGNRERLICRSRTIGTTRIRSRQVCLTAAQWQRVWDESADSVRDAVDRMSEGHQPR